MCVDDGNASNAHASILVAMACMDGLYCFIELAREISITMNAWKSIQEYPCVDDEMKKPHLLSSPVMSPIGDAVTIPVAVAGQAKGR